MSLARMRIDELVNAWVGERYTPFQLGLLGVFDAGPWKRPGGTIDVARLRLDLAGRAGGVADLRRRALDAALRGSSLVGGRSGVRRCPHVVSTRLPHGEDLASWAANRCVRPLDLDRPLWRADVVDGLPGGPLCRPHRRSPHPGRRPRGSVDRRVAARLLTECHAGPGVVPGGGSVAVAS